MEEDLFYTDENKLNMELSLASMHFWLQEENNFELLKLTVLDANGKDSNLARFLSNEKTTATDVIKVVKDLVSNGSMMIFFGIEIMMNLSEEQVEEMIEKLKRKLNEKEA